MLAKSKAVYLGPGIQQVQVECGQRGQPIKTENRTQEGTGSQRVWFQAFEHPAGVIVTYDTLGWET